MSSTPTTPTFDNVFILIDSLYEHEKTPTTDPELAPKLYWGEYASDAPYPDYEFPVYTAGRVLEDYAWATVSSRFSNQTVDGMIDGDSDSARLCAVLTSLVERDNLDYLISYTEEGLFSIVAEDWQSLSDYLFPDLHIAPERVQRAWEAGRELRAATGYDALCAVISALLGAPCTHFTIHGCSQGDWAEAFVLGELDERLDEVGYVKALLEAHLFGVYHLLRLVDRAGEELALAMVLGWTPPHLRHLPYDDQRAAERRAMLGELGVAHLEPAIGTATAHQVHSYKWEFSETPAAAVATTTCGEEGAGE